MKKSRIPIISEVTGAVIVVIGLLYYIFIVCLPYSRQRPAKQLVQNSIYHQGISEEIVTFGGIFLVIGLVTLLVSIFADLIKDKESDESPFPKRARMASLTAGTVVAYIMLAIPFIIPITFHLLYQPINKEITVEHFGCGCPQLGLQLSRISRSFDANCLNAILWVPILFISISLWVHFVKQMFNRRVGPWFVLIGICLFMILSLRLYSRSFWF